MRIEVDAYAGYKADQRPIRFWLRGREYRVLEILDQWYSPDDTWFRVRAEDSGLYILRLNATNGWSLESFRAAMPSQPD